MVGDDRAGKRRRLDAVGREVGVEREVEDALRRNLSGIDLDFVGLGPGRGAGGEYESGGGERPSQKSVHGR